MSYTLFASILVLVTVLVIWFYLKIAAPAFKRARSYIKDVTTCGFLPPKPTARAQRYLRRAARLFSWIQIGKITVFGRENLSVPGVKMLCANHGSHADPAIAALLVNGNARFIAAQQVFTFARGLGSLLFGPLGAFACDLRPGKGQPARDACINVLTDHNDLVLFPEGISWADGVVREFKKGAVYITKAAAERLGEYTYIVPYYIRYTRYPGNWILNYPWVCQYFWIFLNSWWYRRGATVVIGKPIRSDELPADDALGTEFLRQRILALDPAVNSPTGRGELLVNAARS